MGYKIFGQLHGFNDRVDKLIHALKPTIQEQSHIIDILKELIEINNKNVGKKNFKDNGFLKLRSKITDCYKKIIPSGFKLLGLPDKMATAIEKDFDQWTAIPHFNKFEIDLVESYYTRDHYLHPLCVFATGVYLLSCFWTGGVLTTKQIVKELPYWLFCALLHDLGYVIEKYSKILDVFFSKFLMVKYNANFNFKEVMFNGNYYENLKTFNMDLVKFLERITEKEVDTNNIEAIVFDILYAENDHGLISALSAYERIDKVIALFEKLITETNLIFDISDKNNMNLIVNDLETRWEKESEYKKFDQFSKKYFSDLRSDNKESLNMFNDIKDGFVELKKKFKKIVLPIGLHNKLIIKLNQNDHFKIKVALDTKENKDENILIFLLLFCDAIQDWGRTKQQKNSPEFELEKLEFNKPDKIVATYKNVGGCDKKIILSKIEELSRTSNYLKVKGFYFKIKFEDYKTFNIDNKNE